MSRPCKICSWEGLEDFNEYMTRQNPTFENGVKYLAVKGLEISQPTVMNHCYKHIEGYQKRQTHKIDNVENYGGQITENATIPHSFDPQTLRNILGVESDLNDTDTVKEVISRGLNKSIELSTLSLVNALTDHSKGLRQYPIDMVRGLKDLIAITISITTGKTKSTRYETILDVAGLTKKPIKKEVDTMEEYIKQCNSITVWE